MYLLSAFVLHLLLEKMLDLRSSFSIGFFYRIVKPVSRIRIMKKAELNVKVGKEKSVFGTFHELLSAFMFDCAVVAFVTIFVLRLT